MLDDHQLLLLYKCISYVSLLSILALFIYSQNKNSARALELFKIFPRNVMIKVRITNYLRKNKILERLDKLWLHNIIILSILILILILITTKIKYIIEYYKHIIAVNQLIIVNLPKIKVKSQNFDSYVHIDLISLLIIYMSFFFVYHLLTPFWTCWYIL